MLKTQADIRLMGFVPALVANYFIENKDLPFQLPTKYTFESIVMFADVSGFTSLTEKLSTIGKEGSELIAFAINRYMELLISSISRSGGDIFKFAGDAIIVVWPPSNSLKIREQFDHLVFTCRQAIQSALDIQQKLNNTQILENVRLSVKIGFGFGDISLVYVGGVFGRSEYLATGDPLTQAFQSEHYVTAGGQIIISPQVHDLVQSYFEFEHIEKGYHKVVNLMENQKVKMKADSLLMSSKINLLDFDKVKKNLLMFMPAALIPFIEIDAESWSSELRRLTILFMNLGIDLNDDLDRIQLVIQTVQKCIYMNEGSLNKLLLDDKGSTLIVCYGLPPLMHQDDATRAIMASFLLKKQLDKIGCKCYIGIATGSVFAGVVGSSGARREYSVLGDSVNLAARLMQKAKESGKIILCCQQDILFNRLQVAKHKIICKHWQDVLLKGKEEPIAIWEPQDLQSRTYSDLEMAYGRFYQLRTHYHSLPFDEAKRKTFSNIKFDLVGRKELYQSVTSSIKSFIKEEKVEENESYTMEKEMILIKGTFGIGKTYLIKNILIQVQYEYRNKKFKFDENPHFLVSSLNHSTKLQKMNGMKQILKQMIEIYEKRIKNQTFSDLDDLLADEDFFISFPNQPPTLEEEEKVSKMKGIGRRIKDFCDMFFEDEGVAPIILILDDLQYYDELSFYILKILLDKYWKVNCIGLVRDSFWDYPLTKRNQVNPNKEQVNIFEQGLAKISRLENVNVNEIQLQGLPIIKMEELIKKQYGIRQFIYESSEDTDITLFQRRQRTMAMEWQAYIDDDMLAVRGLYDQLMFFESKGLLKTYDFSQFLLCFFYLKTNGNPSILLNFMNVLISNEYIIIKGYDGVVQSNLITILQHEEWLNVDAPRCSIQMNSPILDRLSCLEGLVLKFASVIGDIFDVQTLFKILPLKEQINGEKLIQMLNELEKKDIIEIMNLDDSNAYYRFVNVFSREVLYQRLLYSQRRYIHRIFAEVYQAIPQAFEYDDRKEYRKLEFHWYQCEQTVQVDGDKFKKSIRYIQGYSEKAKRAVIVKKIAETLEMGNTHAEVKLQIVKQVLLLIKLILHVYSYNQLYYRIFDTIKHFQKWQLGIQIPLKAIEFIYQIQNRRSKHQFAQSTEFVVQSSIIIVNGILQDATQLFHFDCESDDDLEEWIIYLEFVKAKAIYEQFVDRFGKIAFPMYLNGYDQNLQYEIRKKQKLQLRKQQDQEDKKMDKQRKRTVRISLDNQQYLMGRQRAQTSNKVVDMKIQEQQIKILKSRIDEFLQRSLLTLWGQLFSQDYLKEIKLGQIGSVMLKHRQQMRLLLIFQVSLVQDSQIIIEMS